MVTLNYYKFNNYYNRQIIKFDSLDLYEEYRVGQPKVREAFNTSDGVETTIVENWSDEMPNYCIATEGPTIVSRWFILEADRIRKDQYNLHLRRDLVSDNFDELIKSPCFIEKATLPQSDIGIYNRENVSFNQIKTKETLIKDKSGIPWIVGYFARKKDTTVTELSGSVAQSFPHDYSYASFADMPFGDMATNGAQRTFGPLSPNSYIELRSNGYPEYAPDYILTLKSDNVYLNEETGMHEHETTVNIDSWPKAYPILKEKITSNGYADIFNLFKNSNPNGNGISQTEVTNLLKYDGAIVQIKSTDKYYKIKIETTFVSKVYDVAGTTSAGRKITEILKSIPKLFTRFNDNTVKYKIKAFNFIYSMKISEVNYKQTTYNITANRYHLIDAPYDMFAIPYGNVPIFSNGTKLCQMNEDLAFSVATAIGEKYKGGDLLYDLQLLPYCPVSTAIKADGSIDVGADNLLYSPITQGSNMLGVILNVSYSSFSLTIPLKEPIVIKDKKLESNTDMYRLTSPNYNGQFEFNAAKNDGIDFFKVDCTYLPFNPYIRVAPNFKGLYGSEFNDSRGLICGGDFSLPIVTNSWETYQLQNKNYQAIFDREIQNMETNNRFARQTEMWQAIAGTLQGGAAGAVMGSMIPNPAGMVGGAIAGMGISAAGAIADKKIREGIRQEALDYKVDMFGMQLDNIKALPNSIAKTTAFNINNKVFPILEYYTCSETEKEAFRQKIKYNGMVVERIGTIGQYLQPTRTYIKGKLIRFEPPKNSYNDDDFHAVNELANEVNKGFFIALGGN